MFKFEHDGETFHVDFEHFTHDKGHGHVERGTICRLFKGATPQKEDVPVNQSTVKLYAKDHFEKAEGRKQSLTRLVKIYSDKAIRTAIWEAYFKAIETNRVNTKLNWGMSNKSKAKAREQSR